MDTVMMTVIYFVLCLNAELRRQTAERQTEAEAEANCHAE